MKINTSIFLLTIAISLTSCGVNRYIAPPFTDVEKILKLKSGASISEVNSILGIKPYDVVHCFETGSKMLVFNYRVKDRSMPLAARSARQATHSEEAQRGGEDWYNANHKELFLLFKNDTLSGVYGERMFGDGSYLELIHDKLTADNGGSTLNGKTSFQEGDYLFLQNTHLERQSLKEKATLEEDENIQKRRKILRYAGGIAAALLGISLLRI